MLIREMKEKDLNQVYQIEAISFASPWSREVFKKELESSAFKHYAVAAEKGKILGYAGMWVILEEAHLTTLAVHPHYRRRRIGRTLLNYMLKQAQKQGAQSIILEVRPSNKAALQLYDSQGFYYLGYRLRYYDQEDALVMRYSFVEAGTEQ